MNHQQTSILTLALSVSLAACMGEASYDPDADAELAIADKADGIFDIIPEIAFDSATSGSLADNDIDFYRIDLGRTDNVTVTMEATSGNLNPHVSFYYGTSTYIRSDSWNRSGDTITKVFTTDDIGTFLIAARVYDQSGNGDYKLSIHCNDGPCAGNYPDPVTFFEMDDVEDCISDAHACALGALPAYNGRVGAVRANQIFQECLNSSATESGDSCATACDWVNRDNSGDTAASVCANIVTDLPWFADRDTECLDQFHYCLDDCLEEGNTGYREEFWNTPIATCLDSGLNSDCPTYAKELQVCGGEIAPESGGECELLCLSTTGAFVDDTSDLCGVDLGCDDYCDVDIELAGTACGGVTSANESCLIDWLQDHWAYHCEDALTAVL